MLNVFDCWYDPGLFDSQFEFAVRSWALQSPEILAEVRAADRVRLDALRGMLVRFGHEPEAADVAARTVYLVQIGYISMQADETVAERMARVAGYVAIFTGRKPKQRELDRFFRPARLRPEGLRRPVPMRSSKTIHVIAFPAEGEGEGEGGDLIVGGADTWGTR